MAFWDFLNNTRRYVGNIYEGAKRVGNVLGTFGKVGYNIGRGIYDYIADNQFNPQNYYFTKNEPIRHNAPMPIKQPYRPPITKMPPITRQHEKREVKEDLGNPYEFWTRQGMRDGGLMKRPILKYVL
jgi:hypothetical protein